MNTENFVASRNDEVVFDNRNKSYGAYSIRKSYTSSLTKGSGGSLLTVGLFIATVQAALMMRPGIVRPFVVPPIPLDFINDIKVIPDQPPPPPKHEVKQPRGFPTKVVTQEVTTPPIENNAPASTEGVNDVGDPVSVEGVGVSIGVSTVPPIVETPKTVDLVEIMPEYEGGAKAMYKFLRKHLHYPHTDQQGTVFVRFVIDVTGTVTGVEVIRGVSGLLDREATRVISIMPKWKPGAQHGAPVNVRMVLPIKFEMERQ